MVPWSIYILTFLYNFTFGALVGESPRAGAILLGAVARNMPVWAVAAQQSLDRIERDADPDDTLADGKGFECVGASRSPRA